MRGGESPSKKLRTVCSTSCGSSGPGPTSQYPVNNFEKERGDCGSGGVLTFDGEMDEDVTIISGGGGGGGGEGDNEVMRVTVDWGGRGGDPPSPTTTTTIEQLFRDGNTDQTDFDYNYHNYNSSSTTNHNYNHNHNQEQYGNPTPKKKNQQTSHDNKYPRIHKLETKGGLVLNPNNFKQG